MISRASLALSHLHLGRVADPRRVRLGLFKRASTPFTSRHLHNVVAMKIDDEKHDVLEHIEFDKETRDVADSERAVAISPEEDGEVTLKTKLALVALIAMYESYLFTLLMYDSSPGPGPG